MATCPYATHKKPQAIAWDNSAITACREGCGRTVFSCPQCYEANRPFARYCRHCSEPISFMKAQSEPQNVAQLQGRNETLKLGDYGVTEVQAIKSYKGLLIVVGDLSLLVFDLCQLHEAVLQFTPPDARIIRGITFTQDGEALLVTTSRTVYLVSLLTMESAATVVYQAPAKRYLTHPVVFCNEQLYAIELDETAQASWLVNLQRGDIHNFDGLAHSVMALTDERIFFCTRDHAFLFKDERVLEQRLPDPLNEAAAAYSEAQDMIYVVGESGLWRLHASDEKLTAVNLPTRQLAATRLAASGDNVFIAHSQGFLVLDPFGGLRWDSEQQYIRAESDGLTPQVSGGYALFTALGQNGGSDLRIHPLNKLNNYKPVVYEQRLLCPPLFSIGRILAATREKDGALLTCSF